MPVVRLTLREKLKAFRDECLTHSPEGVLQQLEAFYNEYWQDPEESLQGKIDFLEQLREIASAVFNRNYTKNFSLWQKCLAYFSVLPEESQGCYQWCKERTREIEALKKEQKKAHSFGWLIDLILFFVPIGKITGKEWWFQLDVFKIKYASHRLMGDTTFSEELFQGQHRIKAVCDVEDDLNGFLHEQKNISAEDKASILRLLTVLGRCKALMNDADLSRVLHSFFNNEKVLNIHLNDATFQIALCLFNLSEGDCALLPHGHNAHASLIEISKQSKDGLTLSYFNTGDGVLEANGILKQAAMIFGFRKVPVRTAELSIDELNNGRLIKAILHATFIANEDNHNREGMLSFHKHVKLSDSEKSYKIQVNGTCANASIDAWMMQHLRQNLLYKFRAYQAAKANEVLKGVSHKKFFQQTSESSSLWNLQQVGANTEATYKSKVKSPKEIAKELASTKKALAVLLKKKGKKIEGIENLKLYADKKLKNNKLSAFEKKYARTGQKWFYQSMSDRAKKARLAYQLLELRSDLKLAC